MGSHQPEQTGFAAATNAGHDLDRLGVLKAMSFQVDISFSGFVFTEAIIRQPS